MNQSYIPRSDADFSFWSDTFTATVKANQAGFGLTAEEMTELEALKDQWGDKFGDLLPKRDAAKMATVEKDDSRDSYEAFLRKVAQKIQNDPNVSNGQKASAGLPIHSTSRTPAPVPTTAPVAVVETCNVREHFLRFSDSNNPHSRVRPNGVFGVEVWFYSGEDVPVDDDQYQMYTVATRMSATVVFNAEQAGKSVWYRFRYINTRGEIGPWSMVYTSTVTK